MGLLIAVLSLVLVVAVSWAATARYRMVVDVPHVDILYDKAALDDLRRHGVDRILVYCRKNNLYPNHLPQRMLVPLALNGSAGTSQGFLNSVEASELVFIGTRGLNGRAELCSYPFAEESIQRYLELRNAILVYNLGRQAGPTGESPAGARPFADREDRS